MMACSGISAPLFQGTLIASVKMDRDRGNRLIAKSLADLVAFGRPYIANPDWSRDLPRMPLLLRLIGKPCMGRGRTVIPITQPTSHRKKSQGA
jgi:hypothetical protein